MVEALFFEGDEYQIADRWLLGKQAISRLLESLKFQVGELFGGPGGITGMSH